MFIGAQSHRKASFSNYLQAGAPKNPRAIAEAIVAALPPSAILAEKPTIGGPGFLNINVAAEYLGQRITKMLNEVSRSLLR